MADISSNEDVLDVRDIIARVEELEGEQEDGGEAWAEENQDDAAELATLSSLLSDLKGYGEDEQWRGAWYPITLIRDDYFEDYARDLVQDIGDLPNGIPSYIEIDWEATADNLRVDYTSCEFEGVTYWFR